MTAAVADYRPAQRIRGKIKKTPRSIALRLVPNPDILAGLGRRKGGRILVGFALEASRGRSRALAKLEAKNLDLIVLDSPEAQGGERATVEILDGSGRIETLRAAKKSAIGEAIVQRLEALASSRLRRR
jgi:phosphopantothenoylcysteine decarboxylase/phosphopantothenate--cysteine ligase